MAFVAIDIRSTPASSVLKWGFILLTAYTGPIGAFLYVLGCREPLSGLHERYVTERWRQVLGSTMHCVAGDGLGILVGAAIAAYLTLSRPADIALEYALGFGFGWTIFQALFMRNMEGGSYSKALASTFLPEFLSMNFLMAGMLPITSPGRAALGGELNPLTPQFWFVMSMALLVGFVVAYPINWWLVTRGLKHGMLTVRDPSVARDVDDPSHGTHQPVATAPDEEHADEASVSRSQVAWMTLLSILAFVFGIGVVIIIQVTL
uniref:DUF4396 domain-containing protein n=1 Tax=Pararhizobium sp. IMCC3301 TaxID=3067904 RepID=UPI0027415920|nr:DUF4396 domain-containing protein [Pararhizobium sp. IMCC3301]